MLPIAWQMSRNKRTGLKNAASDSVNAFDISEFFHTDITTYHVQIISHQIDYGKMFPQLLLVRKQKPLGIGQVGIYRSFHGKSVNHIVLCADKTLGREAYKPVWNAQLVGSIAAMEEFFQRKIELYFCLGGKIAQKAVSSLQTALHLGKSLIIVFLVAVFYLQSSLCSQAFGIRRTARGVSPPLYLEKQLLIVHIIRQKECFMLLKVESKHKLPALCCIEVHSFYRFSCFHLPKSQNKWQRY